MTSMWENLPAEIKKFIISFLSLKTLLHLMLVNKDIYRIAHELLSLRFPPFTDLENTVVTFNQKEIDSFFMLDSTGVLVQHDFRNKKMIYYEKAQGDNKFEKIKKDPEGNLHLISIDDLQSFIFNPTILFQKDSNPTKDEKNDAELTYDYCLEDGKLYVWGKNRLNPSKTKDEEKEFKQIPASFIDKKIKSMLFDNYGASFFLNETGEMYFLGANETTPSILAGLKEIKVKKFFSTPEYSIVLSFDGKLYVGSLQLTEKNTVFTHVSTHQKIKDFQIEEFPSKGEEIAEDKIIGLTEDNHLELVPFSYHISPSSENITVKETQSFRLFAFKNPNEKKESHQTEPKTFK